MPQSSDEKRKSAAAESSGGAAAKKHRGRPFTKGVSGNPGGRPKGIAQIREKYMGNVESIMDVLLHTAIARPDKGGGRGTAVGVAAAREFLDRVTGKAPQPIVGEDGGAPINIDAPALVEALRRYVEEDE
jgi:hypothetical protein